MREKNNISFLKNIKKYNKKETKKIRGFWKKKIK